MLRSFTERYVCLFLDIHGLCAFILQFLRVSVNILKTSITLRSIYHIYNIYIIIFGSNNRYTTVRIIFRSVILLSSSLYIFYIKLKIINIFL